MRVIVSNELQSRYSNYTVYNDLATILRLNNEGTLDIDAIEYLVIHIPDDVTLNFGILLAKLHNQGVEKIVYIKENPEPMISITVKALSCPVIEDELYFDNENELDTLLEELNFGKAVAQVQVNDNIGIVTDFMQSFIRGDAKINTMAYRSLAQKAIKDLEDELNHKDELLMQAGDSAVDIFRRAGTLVDRLMGEREKLTGMVSNLESRINEEKTNSVYNRSGGVMFFPQYKHKESRKVVLVREMSDCKYLTSFLMGYIQHLRVSLNIPSKLVILLNRGDNIYRKYKESETPFSMIVPEVQGNPRVYETHLLITNTPNKVIWDSIFGSKDEVIVVLDKTRGEKNPVIGANVTTLYGVSGMSDLTVYKLNPKECIFSHTGMGDRCFGTIGTIRQYPLDMSERTTMYARIQGMVDLYEKINKLIKLRV